MIKSLLFTTDCLDGAGCSILFSIAHGHLCGHLLPEDLEIVYTKNEYIDYEVLTRLQHMVEVDNETTICITAPLKLGSTIEFLKERFKYIYIWRRVYPSLEETPIDNDPLVYVHPCNNWDISNSALMLEFLTDPMNRLPLEPVSQRFINYDNDPVLLKNLIDSITASYITDEEKLKRTGLFGIVKYMRIQFRLFGMDKFVKKYIEILRSNSDYPRNYLFNLTDIEYLDSIIRYMDTMKNNIKPINDDIQYSDTFRTNFHISERRVYEEAIRVYGDPSLYISNIAMDDKGRIREDCNSLHCRPYKDISDFWKLLKLIRGKYLSRN